MRLSITIHVIALLTVLMTGCGQGKAERESGTVPPKSNTNDKKQSSSKPGPYPFDKGVATIKSMVKVSGKIPKPMPIEMNSGCHFINNGEVMVSEAVVAGSGGELRDCFIYVTAGLEKYAFEPPETPVLIDQVRCRFVPHAVAMMSGQPVEIRNSDFIAHNVHDSRDLICKQQAQQGDLIRTKIPDAVVGAVLHCDIHPWMNCIYAAFEHPFFAITDEKGCCAFPQKLLPGKYTVECYHHAFKKVTRQIEVKEGEAEVTLNFEFVRDSEEPGTIEN